MIFKIKFDLLSSANLKHYLLNCSLFLLLIANICASAKDFNFLQATSHNELKQYSTIMHVHTRLSSGEYTLPQLTQIATSQNVDAIFLSDSFIENIQYGIYPLRHILWARYINKSIITLGTEKYLRIVEEENRRQTNILYIPGVELTPRIYWTGALLKKNLVCHNHQRNLILLGINKEHSLNKLPIVCGFLPGRDTLVVFLTRFLLLIFILSLIAIVFVAPAIARRSDYEPSVIRKAMFFGIFLPVLILMIIVNFIIGSFTIYDIYSPDAPEKFEQNIIDALNKQHILHFWAHPEASDHHDFPKYHFSVDTQPYPEILLKTKNYTGFAGLNEGANNIIKVSNIWDTLLTKYIEGAISKPIWCFGEMLYHYEGQAHKKLSNVETVVLATEKTQQALLEAIQKGRFYSRKNFKGQKIILEKFFINDTTLGETLYASPTSSVIHLNLSLSISSSIPNEPITISIVRNGNSFYTLKTNTPSNINLDDTLSDFENCYYRVIVEGKYPLILVSNPIFIKMKNQL